MNTTGFSIACRTLRWIVVLFVSGISFAAAQSWPTQPIHMIAPVPAGGGVDMLARAIAQKLQIAYGVPVIVENKSGASALVGTDFVAKSPADGTTLLMGYSVLATNKFLLKSLPYDLDSDLVPVAYVGYIPLILVSAPSLEANSVQDLIALFKTNPDKYTYASGGAGAGAHLSAEMFKHMTGVSLLHVPYKGNAPALADLLGGHTSVMFDTITTSIPLVRTGKLKAFATTGPKRSPLAPDIPTMDEAGVKGFEMSAWYMIFAPKKTPPEVLQKLNQSINEVIRDPDMIKQLGEQGVVFTGGSLAQTQTFLDDEVHRWETIINAANIKAE
ncbi:tripartite-type tricarboxylate transporter receptor subunit TctC [Jezberella montanilacus]|uniref:Tripartite-type tricarboxylate transporter receptor subunit TctC n=1 Tax=Jezberella montanilacus TaxID=323426 RepID=A0A2T0XLA9_9BURK|nr:tripartite tricarboxylate transporter substrate binding protein [Jezberella montanilacus]PRY99661.1 tripartite-type tricarboxylate transporter receptor subunit TctC [Jezberella montanilacus]